MADGPKQPLVHVSTAVFDGDRIILVQEAKPAARGLWNLPGGHVELGESIVDAAQRELREETGLLPAMSWLVGIYTGPKSVRFVLGTEAAHASSTAGDQILAVRSATLAELEQMGDKELVGPHMLRRILVDLQARRRYPLAMFGHVDLPWTPKA